MQSTESSDEYLHDSARNTSRTRRRERRMVRVTAKEAERQRGEGGKEERAGEIPPGVVGFTTSGSGGRQGEGGYEEG